MDTGKDIAIAQSLLTDGLSSGGLTKLGNGILALSGVSTYAGTTMVNGGTLVAGNASALGTPAAGTTVASGATLDVLANVGTEAIGIAGSGVGGGGL